MRALVVYFSWQGKNKKMARDIRDRLAADVDEIIELKKRHKTWGYVSGGFQALMRIKTKIIPMQKNPADYDLVVLVSPVWAGQIPPPVRNYLEKNGGRFKKFAFVSVCGNGAKNERVLDEIELAADLEIEDELLLTEKQFKNSYTDKLNYFLRELT